MTVHINVLPVDAAQHDDHISRFIQEQNGAPIVDTLHDIMGLALVLTDYQYMSSFEVDLDKREELIKDLIESLTKNPFLDENGQPMRPGTTIWYGHKQLRVFAHMTINSNESATVAYHTTDPDDLENLRIEVVRNFPVTGVAAIQKFGTDDPADRIKLARYLAIPIEKDDAGQEFVAAPKSYTSYKALFSKAGE